MVNKSIDEQVNDCHSACMDCVLLKMRLEDYHVGSKEDLQAIESIRTRFDTLYNYLCAKRSKEVTSNEQPKIND